MFAKFNEIRQLAKEVYTGIKQDFASFKQSIKNEMALAFILTINGAALAVVLGIAFMLAKFAISVLWFFVLLFWSFLTPGQQWLEFTFILSSLATGAMFLKVAKDMEKSLDAAFSKLNKEIADKTAAIAERDEKIAKLEAVIAEKVERIEVLDEVVKN
jgi:hypothetical protein